MKRKEKVSILLEVAKEQIGKLYEFGSNIDWAKKEAPATFDCSSLVQWCFSKIGIDFQNARSAILQAASSGQEIFEWKDLKSGDLIFFDGERGYYRCDLFNGKKIDIGHVAIYVGDEEIIHATGFAKMVVQEKIDVVLRQSYRRITYMKRYF